MTISAEGKITDVNKAVELITGTARERLIGSDFTDYFTEPEKARACYEQVFSEGIVKDYPLTMRNSNGDTCDVLYNASIYRNEVGEVQGVFASARDITTSKQEEESLLHAKEKAEASGLGLSIAKGMLEALGGTICVESKVGVGSGFFFTIPCVNETTKPFAGSSDRRNKKPLKGASVLVAEDDRTNFLYFKYLLKNIDDLKILHASDGEEAIKMFKTNPGIVLILMDIKMPRINGYEATRHIKLINKDIPIIALTAIAMSGDEFKATEAGCDGYLSKPVSKKSLIEKMAEFVTIV